MKNLKDILTEAFLIKKHQNKIYVETVDLDLPSGIKWTTCNIGANKPEDPGLLFQWGRTDGYKYNDKQHKFLSRNDYITSLGAKYKQYDILKPEDDAVYQATKGDFRMPTKDEIDELLEYTDNKWTELNGTKGMKFMSKKDESKWIFIPAAGYFSDDLGVFLSAGSSGYIWSSSASIRVSASCLYFSTGYCDRPNYYRSNGRSVRGVLNK